jgi:hypothetical protein
LPLPLAVAAAGSSLRGAGSGAASPDFSRTQYLYEDAFSAGAAVAVSSISLARTTSSPSSGGRADRSPPQISGRGALGRTRRSEHSNSDSASTFSGARVVSSYPFGAVSQWRARVGSRCFQNVPGSYMLTPWEQGWWLTCGPNGQREWNALLGKHKNRKNHRIEFLC